MPKFSGEGRLGLLMEISVIILDRLHVTAGYIIWPLFGLGALLIADWIWRGDWKQKHGEAANKRVWVYSVISLVFLCSVAVWLVYGIRYLEKQTESEPGKNVVGPIQPNLQAKQQPSPSPEPNKSPTAIKSKKKPEIQIQSNKEPNNTNTQIGTTQAPIAIAPNGIAVGGNQGIISNPTVNNSYGAPKPAPDIEWNSESAQSESQSKDTKPSVNILIRIKGPFYNPMFDAICDRPCATVQALVKFRLSQADPATTAYPNWIAVRFLTPTFLPENSIISWTIRSKDDQPVSIQKVIAHSYE